MEDSLQVKNHPEVIPKEKTAILNAIGCLMVVFSHFGSYLGIRVFAPLGSGGVSLFLILSGYGLLTSNRDSTLHNFWKKRFIRVLLPYWIVRIVYYTYSLFAHHTFRIGTVLLDLFLIKTQGPNCWYLSFAFFWYLCFWINRKYMAQRGEIATILCFGIISTAVFLFGNSLWSQQAIAFPLGMMLAVKSDKRPDNTADAKKKFLYACMLCVVFVGTLLIRHLGVVSLPKFESLCKMLQNISISLLCILVFTSLYIRERLNHVMNFIGSISYEIYLVHGYFENIIRNNGILVVPVSILLIVILAILFHKVVRSVSHYV